MLQKDDLSQFFQVIDALRESNHYGANDKIQRTSVLASASLISTALGSMATPLAFLCQ